MLPKRVSVKTWPLKKPTTYKFESIAMHGDSVYLKILSSMKTVYTTIDGGPKKTLFWGLGIVKPGPFSCPTL